MTTDWITTMVAATRLSWDVPPSPEQQDTFKEEIRAGRIKYRVTGSGPRMNLASIDWRASTVESLELVPPSWQRLEGKLRPTPVSIFFCQASVENLRKRLAATRRSIPRPASNEDQQIADYFEQAGRQPSQLGLLAAVPGIKRDRARQLVNDRKRELDIPVQAGRPRK